MSGEQESSDNVYNPRYCAVAKKIYERGGDENDLAGALAIPRPQIKDWESLHPEFEKACAEGKAAADDQVEESLRRLASGYEVPAEQIKAYKGRILRQEYTKAVRSNPAAAQFVLTNLHRLHWKAPKDVPGRAPKDALQEYLDSGIFTTVGPVEDPPEYGS